MARFDDPATPLQGPLGDDPEPERQAFGEAAWYRSLFDGAPDSYLVTDRSGTICDANRAAVALLAAPVSDLRGAPLLEFVLPGDRARFHERLRRVLDRGGGRLKWLLRIVPRESASHVETECVAIAVAGPRTGGLTVRWTLRDATARRRRSERIRQLTLELEQRVSERTAQLEAANREKDEVLALERHARNLAETASRHRDEFLATVSHELRTPLNVVLGWVWRLRHQGLEPAERERAYEVIDRNLRAQVQIVADLLDVASLSSGSFRMQLQSVDVGEVLRTAIDSIGPTAELKGIGIEYQKEQVRVVRGDPSRLQQVFWNLLSNAVKFTPHGGRIVVSLRDDGSAVVVTVRDTGPGIPPDFLPLVFDRFRQVDSSLTRVHGGLGLGLSIVRQLIELHAGTIHIGNNDDGAGTRVEVRLPAEGAPATR